MVNVMSLKESFYVVAASIDFVVSAALYRYRRPFHRLPRHLFSATQTPAIALVSIRHPRGLEGVYDHKRKAFPRKSAYAGGMLKFLLGEILNKYERK